MRPLRKCESTPFNTGVSKCPLDMGKVLLAIVVASGTKLPADLTADKLEELVHADGSNRVYGIYTFREYAKNGGEVQTSAQGYGPEEITGISARKDTFTLDKYHPELHAAITRRGNKACDVYFVDEKNVLYGLNDGTDLLAGYPMSSIYSDATPHPTSSGQPQMTVTFAHEDAKRAIVDFDYVQLGFNALSKSLVLGLTPVTLVKAAGTNAYKLHEVRGGNDVTPIYGPLIADSGVAVIAGASSAVAYDEDSETLTIAAEAGVTPKLKSPKVLFENDIKGIEQTA